jgi:predicted nucleic acid-binding protein
MTLKGFKEVYSDASFFIALFSKKDTKHRRALELFNEIKQNRIVIHTCWFVISEAMTILLYQYGYSEALAFNQLTFTEFIILQKANIIKLLPYLTFLVRIEKYPL